MFGWVGGWVECRALLVEYRGCVREKSGVSHTFVVYRILSSCSSYILFPRVVHRIQPVPWKMRLDMLHSMVIEILNGGEILVNCKFKFNKNLNLNLYCEIPRNSNPVKISIRLCTVRYPEI